MNRDALLATIIGFAIGLLITASIVFGPQLFKSFGSMKLADIRFSFTWPFAKKTPSVTNKTIGDAKNGTITNSVSSPQNESIAASDSLVVKGTVISDTEVILSGPLDDTLADVQKNSFSGTVALEEGKNIIHIIFSNTDNISDTPLTVYYIKEKI